MDYKQIDLNTMNPVALTVNMSDVSGPYFVGVKDHDNGLILYEREYNKPRLTINLPKHNKKIKLFILGKNAPKIVGYMIGNIEAPEVPLLVQTETRRDFEMSDIKFKDNTEMRSPARFHINTPLVEFNPDKLSKFSHGVNVFIGTHELAHYYQDSEIGADALALIMFVNKGYNLSCGIYALTHVLKRSPDNLERILAQSELADYINSKYYSS